MADDDAKQLDRFGWAAAEPLREWYEPDGDPREALGRMARRLKNGGALYLGDGVGVESVRSVQGQVAIERYQVTPNGSKHDGPLSAVTAAFVKAGSSTSADTPGGAQKVTDPAIAARLHELDASEREERATILRYEARAAARARQGALTYQSGGSYSDDGWEARRMDEARANITAIAAERKRLLAGKAQESAAVPHELLGDPLAERKLDHRGSLHGDDGKFRGKDRAQDRAPSITQTIATITAPPEPEPEPVSESGLIGAMFEASE